MIEVKRRCKKPVDPRLLPRDVAAGARRRLGGAKEVTREGSRSMSSMLIGGVRKMIGGAGCVAQWQ
jgi:hypothetical protein